MAGALVWHRATARYTDTTLRAAYLGSCPPPTGLGDRRHSRPGRDLTGPGLPAIEFADVLSVPCGTM